MSIDPRPTPYWLVEPDAAAPCECGEEPWGPIIVVKGETGLVRWYHVECVPEDMIEDDEEEE